MNTNIRFYTENLIDNITISGTSEATNYPYTYIQDAHRAKRWHSTTISGQHLSFDVGGSGEACNYIAIINPNMTSGQFRITATNNPDYETDLLLDENISVTKKVFGYGESRYGKHGYGGTLLTSEIDKYTPGGRILLHHFESGIIGARYWRLYISDTCSSEDNFYALGRVFLGIYYEPTYNIDSFTLYPVDLSIVNESQGGQGWVDIAPQRREFSFNFDLIKKTELYFDMFNNLYYYGKRRDIIVSIYPEGSEVENLFCTLYGRFVDVPGISRMPYNNYTLSGDIQFRESL